MINKFGFDSAVSTLAFVMALGLFLLGVIVNFHYSPGLLFPALFVSYIFFFKSAFWAITSVLLFLVFLGLAFMFAAEGVKNTKTTEGFFLAEVIKFLSLGFILIIGLDILLLMIRLPKLLI